MLKWCSVLCWCVLLGTGIPDLVELLGKGVEDALAVTTWRATEVEFFQKERDWKVQSHRLDGNGQKMGYTSRLVKEAVWMSALDEELFGKSQDMVKQLRSYCELNVDCASGNGSWRREQGKGSTWTGYFSSRTEETTSGRFNKDHDWVGWIKVWCWFLCEGCVVISAMDEELFGKS